MKIAYACQAGRGRGWGHLERGRTLVEAADEGSAILVGAGHHEAASVLGGSGVPLVAWRNDLPCVPDDPRWDVLVVDDYDVPAEWLEKVARTRPTFVVDDWKRTRLNVTGLINVNIGAARTQYPDVRARRWLLGPEYALIRQAVRGMAGGNAYDGPVREILVTLGGSDPDGRTAEVVSDLVESAWYTTGGRIVVVVGGGYTGPRPWESWSAARCAGLYAVRQPTDFPQLLKRAHLAICGASTVSYELALLGTPFVPLAFVDNQAQLVDNWRQVGIGEGICTWDRGWRGVLAATIARLIDDGPERAALAKRAQAYVDGHGAQRMLRVLREESV